MRNFTIAVGVAVFALAPMGCGGSPPTGAAPGAETALTYDEWKRIEDPEEKFNRHTIQRLPKEMQQKALREQRAVK